jgi:hypothetical protein
MAMWPTTSQLLYIYALKNGWSRDHFSVEYFTITKQIVQNETRCDSWRFTDSAEIINYTQPNGQFGTGTEIALGTVITTSQTIYISYYRIWWNELIVLTKVVLQLPITTQLLLLADVNVCNSYTLPALTVGNYFYSIWRTWNTIECWWMFNN